MAQVFADVIIQNTGSAKGDHFWDNAEYELIKSSDSLCGSGIPTGGKEYRTGIQLTDEFGKRTEQPL